MMPYFNSYPYQPQFNPQGANARLVSNFSDIHIGDIPTDGTPTFFIKNDMSEIQTRKWSNDGRVISTIYKPFIEDPNNVIPPAKEEQIGAVSLATTDIMKRLDEIDAILEKLVPKTMKGKKEDETI